MEIVVFMVIESSTNMLRIGLFHCMLNNMVISQQLHTSSQTMENMSISSKQFTLQTFSERKYFTLRSLLLAVAKFLIWSFYAKALSHRLYLWLYQNVTSNLSQNSPKLSLKLQNSQNKDQNFKSTPWIKNKNKTKKKIRT